MKAPKNLDEILGGAKTVGIAGHVKPDGDCCGSTLGVYNYLRTYHPEVQVTVYLEKLPPVFDFLPGAKEVEHGYPEAAPHDLFLVLDLSEEPRLGQALTYYMAAKRTYCIDHHLPKGPFADESWIVPDFSSTAELVYETLRHRPLTVEVAECLYTGIVHDTGVFQYDCTTSETMAAAGEMMKTGIRFSRIVNDTFFAKTYAENRILGYALYTSRRHFNGWVISSIVREEDLSRCNARLSDLEGIVSSLRSTTGVEAAIFLYQNGEGSYKASLRSTELVDCAAVCRSFGGGGHVRASGATIEGSDPEEILERILAEMERYFDAWTE